MAPGIQSKCTAFAGTRRIASGTLFEMALAVKAAVDPVLIFDDATGEMIEMDLRGSAEEVLARLSIKSASIDEPPRGPGRPKLGVVAREVTLLPRHWDWLNAQPGGASVALRKLVEEASRARAGLDRERRAREAAYRFMSAMAGNLPGFEEAIRGLFAGNREHFRVSIETWPADIRDHAIQLAEPSFPKPSGLAPT
jgi:uncharacterized protein